MSDSVEQTELRKDAADSQAGGVFSRMPLSEKLLAILVAMVLLPPILIGWFAWVKALLRTLPI